MNAQQRAAAEAPNGYIQIVAGPGTGKTFTLVHRIVELLKRKVPADQIIVLTFTNAAAREIRNRATKYVPEAQNIVVGTFHSLAFQFLVRNGRAPTIIDEWDKTDILKGLGAEHPVKQARLISQARCGGSRGIQARRKLDAASQDLLLEYEAILDSENKTDFDGLLLQFSTLLKEDKVSVPYQAVIVDEFQDTNEMQLEITLQLSERGGGHNCTVVGDPDQSIYGFRNAEPRNFFLFKERVEASGHAVKILYLELNYRSNHGIVNQASRMIACAEDRFGKDRQLRPSPDAVQSSHTSTRPQIVGLSSAFQQAQKIQQHVSILVGCGVRHREIAILSRTGRDLELVEAQFTGAGIPVKVVGGRRFAERPEARAILDYLRVCADSDDYLAIMRTINNPKRGIGKATIDRLFSPQRGGSLRIIENLDANLPGINNSQRSGFADYLEILSDLRSLDLNSRDGISKAIEKITRDVIGQKEPSSRQIVIMELLQNSIEYFEPLEEDGRPLLSQWLTRWSLSTEPPASTDQNNLVTLSTVHSAKGLEWPVVCLMNCHEDSKHLLTEEDRRVLYVALTRPMAMLVITFNKTEGPLHRFVDSITDNTVARVGLNVTPGDLAAIGAAVGRRLNGAVEVTSRVHNAGTVTALPGFIMASELPKLPPHSHTKPVPTTSFNTKKRIVGESALDAYSGKYKATNAKPRISQKSVHDFFKPKAI